MNVQYYEGIAESHRRKAANSDTAEERSHWEAEAGRFQRLALIARGNPEEARRRYRPTRAYEQAASGE